jgi:hypothetical protein
LRVSINLTPYIPLSLTRRGGGEERGADAPLRHPKKVGELKRGKSQIFIGSLKGKN